jgi:hypothetical protein
VAAFDPALSRREGEGRLGEQLRGQVLDGLVEVLLLDDTV